MAKVFVTGANGLLGTNLCKTLLQRGDKVVALVRQKDRYLGDMHPQLELIEGSLFMDLLPYLKGVDFVVHVAATTAQNGLNYEAYWKVNCQATAQLFHAAERAKVKRFVFISTANTLQFGSLELPGDEQTSMPKFLKASYYARSKWEAEKYLLAHAGVMDVILLNPTFMLGPFDAKPSSGKILKMVWKKRLVFYPPGGKNFVHVQDVVMGVINSFTLARPGERYLIANENWSYKAFFQRVNILTNQKPILIQIPASLLKVLGSIGYLLRGIGIQTPLSPVNMKMLCIGNYFSNEKSKTELKIKYQPIDVAITDAIKYFKYEAHVSSNA